MYLLIGSDLSTATTLLLFPLFSLIFSPQPYPIMRASSLTLVLLPFFLAVTSVFAFPAQEPGAHLPTRTTNGERLARSVFVFVSVLGSRPYSFGFHRGLPPLRPRSLFNPDVRGEHFHNLFGSNGPEYILFHSVRTPAPSPTIYSSVIRAYSSLAGPVDAISFIVGISRFSRAVPLLPSVTSLHLLLGNSSRYKQLPPPVPS